MSRIAEVIVPVQTLEMHVNLSSGTFYLGLSNDSSKGQMYMLQFLKPYILAERVT